MTWFGWTLIGILALNVIVATSRVGELRKPLTASDATAALIINALIVVGLLAVGTGHL